MDFRIIGKLFFIHAQFLFSASIVHGFVVHCVCSMQWLRNIIMSPWGRGVHIGFIAKLIGVGVRVVVGVINRI